MARALRVNRPEVWYHITARGTERRAICVIGAVAYLWIIPLIFNI